MRRLIICIMVGFMLFSVGTAGGKTELQWKNLTTGLAEAKKSNKKVLLDIYTDWCGWCKRLDRDVYGNEKVASYLTQQYVVVKLNAESDAKVTYKGTTSSEMEIARAFGVTGYPTIIFLESSGEAINSLGGYVDAEKFLPIVKFIGEDYYKKMSWQDYVKKNGPKGSPTD